MIYSFVCSILRLRGIKTFRNIISIIYFIQQIYQHIYNMCSYFPKHFFFVKKSYGIPKNLFCLLNIIILPTSYTTIIQNNGSSVGNGLNRYTAADQQMSYYSCFSLLSPVHLPRSLIKKYTYIYI